MYFAEARLAESRTGRRPVGPPGMRSKRIERGGDEAVGRDGGENRVARLNMLYPVCVHQDGDGSLGAVIPDFPGCFSGTDDWQDLPRMVREAQDTGDTLAVTAPRFAPSGSPT